MSEQPLWRHGVFGWMARGWLGVLLALLLSGCSVASATTWQNIGPNAHSVVALAVSSLNPPTLFAGSSGQGLFRSRDNGNTWEAVNAGLPQGVTVQSIVLDLTQVGLVYVGTDAGVFLSSDAGDHWQSASRGLPEGADGAVTALLLNPDDPLTLYAGTAHKGVYISHDGAKSWSASATGLPAGAMVHALLAEIKGQQVLLFAALAGAGVYQSRDNGASWSASSGGLPAGSDGLSLLEQPSSPGGLYVGTSAGLYRSTDDGASWRAVNTGLGAAPQVFALALNDQQVGLLYAATKAGVYRSGNGGASWDQVAAGIPTDHPAVALAVLGSATSIGTIYASAGQVYRYPSAAASASGQIFTFVVLGILALLFVWLFLQQRRLLQRLTPPPIPPSPSGGEAGGSGTERANLAGAKPLAAAEDQSTAALDKKSGAGSEDAGSERQD
jgi:photosystem II stability/assembly factor-like uncharacterized protein